MHTRSVYGIAILAPGLKAVLGWLAAGLCLPGRAVLGWLAAAGPRWTGSPWPGAGLCWSGCARAVLAWSRCARPAGRWAVLAALAVPGCRAKMSLRVSSGCRRAIACSSAAAASTGTA